MRRSIFRCADSSAIRLLHNLKRSDERENSSSRSVLQRGRTNAAPSLRRQPGLRGVAVVAGRAAGRDVIGRLAGSPGAVVARLTGADGTGVIEACSGPGVCVVANAALLRRENVVDRFADSRAAVVARLTGADHVRMVDA